MFRKLSLLILIIASGACHFQENILEKLGVSPETHQGFILYYFSPATDCGVCTQDISLFPQLEQAYPEILFIPVLRKDSQPFSQFEEEMKAIGIETPAVDDRTGKLASAFHLEDQPYVLFLSPEGRAVQIRRLTLDIPIDRTFFQRWIEQL